MFKFKSIEMGTDFLHGYGDGAKPGIKCVITMQTGEMSYDKTEFKLPPEAVKRVVKAALDEMQAMIVIDHDSVDVEGAAPPSKPSASPRNDVETAHMADEVVL